MKALALTLIGLGVVCSIGLLTYAIILGQYSPIVLFGVGFNMWAIWQGFRGI